MKIFFLYFIVIAILAIVVVVEKLEKGYGGRVVEQLSADLKSEFPDTDGFSPRSLLDMKRLYEFYTDSFQIPPQPVAVLPWGHNRLILSKIKNNIFFCFLPAPAKNAATFNFKIFN